MDSVANRPIREPPGDWFKLRTHSFLLRREKFGGILVDRTTGVELWLNQSACLITEGLLRGMDPQALERQLHSRYRVDRPAALPAEIREVGELLNRRFSGQENESASSLRCLGQGALPTEVLSAPLDVFWEVTYACNLNCPHCYSQSGACPSDQLSTTEALSLVDEMAEAGVYKVIIGGGEPFLRPDLFQLVEQMRDRRMRPVLVTNGTLLGPEQIRRLVRLGIRYISISLDGASPHTHDKFRGKPGTFTEVVRTLRLLAEEEFQIEVQTTVHRSNVGELPAICRLVSSIGVRTWTVRGVVPAGRFFANQNQMPDNACYASALGKVNELQAKNPQLRIICGIPLARTFDRDYVRSQNPDRVLSCGAAFRSVGLTPDGRLKPCSFLTGEE